MEVSTKNVITSLEIATLSGKRHSDILRSIRRMEKSWLEVGQRNFAQSSYLNEQNRPMPMYKLSKTQSLYIATKFNDEARAKLVLRWEQLENEKRRAATAEQFRPKDTVDALELIVKELKSHKEEITNLKKSLISESLFTIFEYADIKGAKIKVIQARTLDTLAMDVCRQRGVAVDHKEVDGLKTTMYPRFILDQYFGYFAE